MTLLDCEECGAPAEVRDEFTLPSTDGPVRHLVTMCMNQHNLTRVVPVACNESAWALAQPGHRHTCTGLHSAVDGDHYCGDCGRHWWRHK